MPPVGYQGQCHYCGREVISQAYGSGVAYGVVGWELSRSQGGANQITMRQRVPEKVAHVMCVKTAADRQKRGIARDQVTLDFG